MVRCQKTNCANFDSDDLPHSFLSWEKLGHTGSRPCPHICCGSNIWLLGGSSIWRTTQEMEPAWAQVSLVHIWSMWLGFTGLVFRIFFHQAAVGGGSRLHGPGSHLHAVRLGLGPPGLRRHSYWSGERILPKLPLLGFWWEMGVYFILASSEDLMSIAVQKRAIWRSIPGSPFLYFMEIMSILVILFHLYSSYCIGLRF